MGLHQRPNLKPVSKNDDLLHFLVAYLVWDDYVERLFIMQLVKLTTLLVRLEGKYIL